MGDHHVTVGITAAGLTEGILSVILNGLLLLVFIKNPLRDMWQCSSILIFNVSLSDGLFGLFYAFWNTFLWHSHEPWLQLTISYSLWVFTLTSTLTLLALSLERYLALAHPWNAARYITRQKTIVACVMSWLLSIIACVASVDGQNFTTIALVFGSSIELSVFVQIWLYLSMWRYMRRVDASTPANHEDEQRQLTVIVFVLVIITIITELPLVICYQVRAILAWTNKVRATRDTLGSVVFYLQPLFGVNFFLNPVIYAWRLRKYRKALVAVFSNKEQTARIRASNIITQSQGRSLNERVERLV